MMYRVSCIFFLASKQYHIVNQTIFFVFTKIFCKKMPCGCSSEFEAKTAPRKKGGRKKGGGRGPKVLVRFGDRQFYAHRRKGNPANLAKMKAKNPGLYYRAQATRQIADELKQQGKKVDVKSKAFHAAVSKRAAELRK